MTADGTLIVAGWCRDRLAETYVRAIHAAFSGDQPRAATPQQLELLECCAQLWWAAWFPRWPAQHATVDALLAALEAWHCNASDETKAAVHDAIGAWRATGFPGI